MTSNHLNDSRKAFNGKLIRNRFKKCFSAFFTNLRWNRKVRPKGHCLASRDKNQKVK